MSKTTDNYEEQVRQEFESTQNVEDTPKTQETVKDLGRVNLNQGFDVNNDPDIKRINDSMGYIDIPMDCLPSQGRFYPENTRISIRAARVGEIREFSIIDEDDPYNVRDKIAYIISHCTKVYFGNTLGHYKDILDGDRLIILFKIRELTFTEGQTSIKVPVPAGACSTPGCHPQETIDFDSNKVSFLKPSEQIEKYYDPVNRCYTFQTKSFGEIRLYPPSIGVSDLFLTWIEEQKNAGNEIDAPLVDILQYLIKDWRTFSKNQIKPALAELAGWSANKFSLVSRLKDEINVDIDTDIVDTCAQCGGELRFPITFPDGLKSLFVPTISDFRGELL